MAPAAKPKAKPGPQPHPRASAGAVTVVAPTVATVAKIANAFLMHISSIEYPRNNADGFFWFRGNRISPLRFQGFRSVNVSETGTRPAIEPFAKLRDTP
jgi:hypothetical protein